MQLNTIRPAAGAKHAKKRVGRGIGSGTGKTAGLGHKGQRARAGGYHYKHVGGVCPAAQAGLQPGDVIVAFDGQTVTGIDALIRLLSEEKMGISVPVSAVRGTRRIETAVTPALRS